MIQFFFSGPFARLCLTIVPVLANVALASELSASSSGEVQQVSFTSCISNDQMVAVQMGVSKDDSSMYDLVISSRNPNRPAESTFPTVLKESPEKVQYHLLGSDFVLLSIEKNSGNGKLATGQFLSPNPYIDVKCLQ